MQPGSSKGMQRLNATNMMFSSSRHRVHLLFCGDCCLGAGIGILANLVWSDVLSASLHHSVRCCCGCREWRHGVSSFRMLWLHEASNGMQTLQNSGLWPQQAPSDDMQIVKL
jgi:hypothetical protein